MDKIIWITVINYGYINYTKNFLESMKRNNCSFPLIIYCLDEESLDALNLLKDNYDIKCLSAKPFTRFTMEKNLSSWKTIEYKRIVFSKLDAIKYTLSNYKLPVGYIDTDIILFKDPTDIMLRALNENPGIMSISQCDEKKIQCSNKNRCHLICTGVIVFRESIDLELFNYSLYNLLYYLTDQHFLVDKMLEENIKYMTIDKNIFLNGAFPGLREGLPIIPDTAVLLHYNYMQGSEKELTMKKNDMWYI